MPEGDTVWQAARRLRALDGETLCATDFRVPSLATADLAGRRVLTTRSRGKHLLTRVEDGLTLHSHLGMDGGWTVGPPGERWRKPAYLVRVVLRTAGHQAVGHELQLDLVRTEDEDAVVGHLGPDLLGPDWDAAEAVRRIAAQPDEPIASALLEQRNLAGIGNVYKCELLFLRGLHPWLPAGSVADLFALVTLAHRVLMANRNRWEQITTGDSRPGRQHYVYGRAGAPCLRCRTPIEQAEQGSDPLRRRVTFWCPRCQPAP